MTDAINPAHYSKTPPGIDRECIDYVHWLGFSQGCAAKYAYRAGRKGDARECLLKASWYLRDALDRDNGTQSIGRALRNTIRPAASLRAELFDLIVGGHCVAALQLIDEVLESGADLDGDTQ